MNGQEKVATRGQLQICESPLYYIVRLAKRWFIPGVQLLHNITSDCILNQ